MLNKQRPIAIYLPQFHPIPENDKWWGKGFTEWTNVTKSKPLFKGHYQPHLPTELGFYDLRLKETFHEQIALAREAGIYGFMFYEYWFEGKRLLEQPLEIYLEDKKNNFPFCLCWANENWTKRWDGKENDILLKQSYTEEDYRDHFREVYARFFLDERYIKINGNPVLCIYKTGHIPNIELLTSIWKEETRILGFKDLYIIRCETNGDEIDPKSIGCDAAYEFHPIWNEIEDFKIEKKLLNRLLKTIKYKRVVHFIKKFIKKERNNFYDFEKYVQHQLSKKEKEINYIRYPGIMPAWDNTPRRSNGNAFVFLNSSPELYEKWLLHVVTKKNTNISDENLIFINAWNEWAEGCHLEPCIKYGKAYLEKTKNILDTHNR